MDAEGERSVCRGKPGCDYDLPPAFVPPADDTRDFVRSTILAVLDQDPWRVQMIMLIAIALEDEVEVILQPGRMLSLANRLAAVGVPKVAEMLKSGDAEPIWNLSEKFKAMLNDRRDI